jgi:hypothetical protein
LHKYENYSPHRLRKIQSQLKAIDPHHTIFYPVLQPESGKSAINRSILDFRFWILDFGF